MRRKAISLQNPRRHRLPTVITAQALIVLLGRNNAGQSTIPDALDVFFEGEEEL